ncbi:MULTISPECIES: hypothetical protein [Marinobacter]|uniref:DUF7352 domain-containing protein n=1 Tax=Marinobacter suaedae TaxID=3057675 RepID=A0ABT8W1D2_9GAMM|nr:MULTISPECIES: hypothetical protein [unclassified Marinobacter]MDO3722059.1 hypothetical protein [Marinobacter sp. chi1]
MKTIHKFRLEAGKEPVTLSLCEGSRVVRSEYIVSDKAVYIWVEQPLKASARLTDRRFRVAFSGEPVPDSYQYVDTALDPFGPEAYHVFEVPRAEHPWSDVKTDDSVTHSLGKGEGWRSTVGLS